MLQMAKKWLTEKYMLIAPRVAKHKNVAVNVRRVTCQTQDVRRLHSQRHALPESQRSKHGQTATVRKVVNIRHDKHPWRGR